MSRKSKIALMLLVPALLAPVLLLSVMMTVQVGSLAGIAGQQGKTRPVRCEDADQPDITQASTALVPAGDVAMKVAAAMAAKGYSRAATAGVLGNLQLESHMDPAIGEVGGGGFGLAQWTPRSKIAAWGNANGFAGRPDSDPDLQAAMIAATASDGFNNHYIDKARAEGLTGDSLLDMFHTAQTPELAAAAYMWGYERPAAASSHEDLRKRYANGFYSQIGNIRFTVPDGSGPGVSRATPDIGAGIDRAADDATVCKVEAGADFPTVASNVRVEAYVKWMEDKANDQSIGYSQKNRTLNPDVDCSSFVFYALQQGAGFPLTGAPFTTFTMEGALGGLGFVRHPLTGMADLQRGDILLNAQTHTEVYAGNGKTVGAHSPKGHPEPGDQTGNEVSEVPARLSEFTEYFRFGA